jgi:hypothetical protein
MAMKLKDWNKQVKELWVMAVQLAGVAVTASGMLGFVATGSLTTTFAMAAGFGAIPLLAGAIAIGVAGANGDRPEKKADDPAPTDSGPPL